MIKISQVVMVGDECQIAIDHFTNSVVEKPNCSSYGQRPSNHMG